MARFTRRKRLWSAALLILLGLAPLLCTALAAAVAGLNGCRLDESGSHPCVILGHDFGETLYLMGMMAWLGIVTLGLSWIGLLWCLAEGTLLLLRRARRG